MKNLYAIIIVLGILSLTIVTIGLPDANAISGTALFMKTNSTGKIYANFTFPVLDNRTWNLSPGIYLAGIAGSPVQIDSYNMTITADPNSFTSNKGNVTVTYTITAKNDTRGVYGLFLFFCGQDPLIVGLNESNVNYDEYNQFFSAVYHCPMMTGSTPKMNIIGYYNIIPKIIDIDSNNTIKSVQTLGQMTSKIQLENSTNSITQHNVSGVKLDKAPYPFPLQQYRSGTAAKDVLCWGGLQLMFKTEDGTPACVKPDTAQILVERGWAKPIAGSMIQTSKEPIRIIPEYPITTGINKNGTITDSETIEILFDNFKQTSSPLVIQIFNPQGGIYRVDNISSNDIQPDGFYKYQIYIKGNQSAMGQYKVIATHDNATASIDTYLSDVVP